MSELRRVSSSESFLVLRAEGVISVGGSEELYHLMSRKYNYARPNEDELARQTYIVSLFQDLQWIMKELGYQVDDEKVESWAMFLHEMLTRETRRYHSVAHLYEISAGASPLQLLAAMFRDTISHYIDGGVHPRQIELIDGVLVKGTFILNSQLENKRDELVAQIFGYKPGDNLRSLESHRDKGIDIFLSAVSASRLLGEYLSLTHTAQLSAILEATIPFRRGTTSLNKLYQCLSRCSQDYELEFSTRDLVETVQQGVDLRNRTAGNMVTDDVAVFLDHTWRLLPEQNFALRKSHLHTLSDYYNAILSMTQLVQNIESESVYGTFRGLPTPTDSLRFHAILTRNRSIAVIYLQARLLSVAIVCAFACLTGGDAPKSFFFGDLPSLNRESERLGDGLSFVLPSTAQSKSSTNGGSRDRSPQYTAEVYDLLRGERMAETGFDTRNAPLAAYIYQAVGDFGMERALPYCVPEVISARSAAWRMLAALPNDLIVTVGNEIGTIAISRQKGIRKVCDELRRRAADHLMRFM